MHTSRLRSAAHGLLAAALLACLVVAGCATGGVAVIDDDARVLVNDVAVSVNSHSTVLDLLKRGTFAGRLPDDSRRDRAPLVVLDGIYMVDGLSALADLPALQVQSVRTLRRLRAVAVYGPLADGGAIVVQTRRGRP